jgi:PII-like signaling protein
MPAPSPSVASEERDAMHLPRDAVLLRIFIGETDRHEGRPLYEAIVLKAREIHMAGATVLRGPMSYGKSSRLHSAKILRISEDLPIVVEIVDSQERIDQFLPILDTMIGSGLVTVEKVQVIRYGNADGA